jgi:two-component sensor histidine kinase/DNA-binding response OmpR family regulator
MPASATPEEALTPAPDPVARGSAEGDRILVAEPGAALRDTLRRLLAAAGHRVTVAADGEAALAAALADPPSLVLAEVTMPRLGGSGLLRALRAEPRLREVPVLLLAARTGEAAAEGPEAGADDYVMKPFSGRELLARVGAHLRLGRIRREAAAALRDGEARWRGLLDRMQEGCLIGEVIRDAAGRAVDFRLVEANAAVERLTGMPPERLLDRPASAAIPGLEPFWTETFARVAETGAAAHVEHQVAPLGRWFEVSAYRIGPGRFGALFLDVTARRAAAERQVLLAREVDHRAKNALAVVQSVVRLTRASDIAGYVEAVEGRVAALARAHTLLAEDRWRGAELRAIVEEELAAHRGGGRVAVAGPALRLRPEAVQPLSMVLHELATNAAKHGALSVPYGRLEIAWRRTLRGGTVRLCWAERGGPPIPRPPERRGFGSTLIEATVSGQLAGAVAMSWNLDGLRCELTIAPDRIAEPEAGDLAPGDAALLAAEAERASAGVALRGRLILVVEDEPLVAMAVAQTLKRLGCEVLGPAGSLTEARDLAAAAAERLDAAVLDMNLQGESALPVAQLLADRGVPVIWATGYGELPAGSETAGITQLLRKPVAEGDLETALRQILAQRGARGGAAG